MPAKPAVAFQYRSDGTGRDSYVIKNSGGLKAEYYTNTADSIFASQLRSSNPSTVRAATLLN